MSDDPRDAVIDALIPRVEFDGWTTAALRAALISLGDDPDDAPLLFPEGAGEMIEAFCALADERMIRAAEQADFAALRLPARVRAIIALRLQQNHQAKPAIRRALAWLSLPRNTPRALRITAATADAIWHAAGDISADFSWYTKRATLAAIYTATLLFWLRDTSEDDEPSLTFLDRRLANVASFGKFRKRIEARRRVFF